MRYLSLVFLLILMGWSWGAVHRPSVISEWIHWSLQEEVKKIIANKVNLSSNKIEFKKIWTENVTDNQVKTHFHYTYKNKALESLDIQGYMILQAQDRRENLFWKATDFHILKESIFFQEAVTVRPSDQ